MFVIKSPLKPSLKRYYKLFFRKNKITITRALMYEEIEKISLNGKILDFGGGDKADYVAGIKARIGSSSYESINISESIEPTYLIKPSQKIPLDSESIDTIFSANTLEHIFDLESTLKDFYRVLKKNGTCFIFVPFLYRVHGCPDDFHRPTASWWGRKLGNLNFDNIEIKPLVWDPVTSSFALCEGILPFSYIFRRIIPLYGLIYSYLKSNNKSEYYSKTITKQLANYSSGYFIKAEKK